MTRQAPAPAGTAPHPRAPRGDGMRVVVALLALLVVLAFAFQGTRGIWEPDEGRYTSAGINMHEHGDWLVPTVDGEHAHLTKPPLTYWALAASFALLGHHEWAARLPSALAFVGTGLLVFGLGRRLCPHAPWLPAVVWASSLGPVAASNVVSTDPLLVLFETAAVWAFVEGGARSGGAATRWYVLAWFGFGLAFLTKGPPGLLPLLAVVAYLAAWERRRLAHFFTPAGVLLFALVGLSWFAVMVARDASLLGYFLGYEFYGRVFTPAHDRHAQWYGALEVYGPVLLLGTLPWAPLALAAAGGPRHAWRRLRDRLRSARHEWRLLACWLLVPLAVLCLARSRLHLYALPLFVPLALLLARPLARWAWFEGARRAWVIGLSAAALVAFKGALAYWPSDRDAREIAAQLERVVDPHDIEQVVFVGMRPLYGLNLYVDRHILGIELGEDRFEYSRSLEHPDFCTEVAARPRAVYAFRENRVAAVAAAAAACGRALTRLGQLHADGFEVLIHRIDRREAPATDR